MKNSLFLGLALALSLSFLSFSNPIEKLEFPFVLEKPTPVLSMHDALLPGRYRTAEEMVAAGFKRYGIEKGYFVFRLEGTIQGTEEIFFDNWGWREAKYTRTRTDIGEFHERTNEVQYIDGEFRYVYHPDTQVADYFETPQVQRSADKYSTKDMVIVGIEMLKNMGGTLTGKGMIGDLECEIWEIKKHRTTLYMWQGLTMSENSLVGNFPVRRTCVQIKTEEPVPVEKLLLPKGAKVARPVR